MLAAGVDAFGTDLVRRVPTGTPWFYGARDFLKDGPSYRASSVVMNPPFGRALLAEAFIRQALQIAAGKVCAFVDIRFIAGSKRAGGLFREFPPARIWIVTPRVSCPPGEYLAAGGKAEGGTADWVWLCWDRSVEPAGILTNWLNVNDTEAM